MSSPETRLDDEMFAKLEVAIEELVALGYKRFSPDLVFAYLGDNIGLTEGQIIEAFLEMSGGRRPLLRMESEMRCPNGGHADCNFDLDETEGEPYALRECGTCHEEYEPDPDDLLIHFVPTDRAFTLASERANRPAREEGKKKRCTGSRTWGAA